MFRRLQTEFEMRTFGTPVKRLHVRNPEFWQDVFDPAIDLQRRLSIGRPA